MALFLPDLEAVFLHAPKCGGTWVKAALAASGLRCESAKGPGQHGPAASYNHAARRFCFVRHPVAWIESAWRGLHESWPNRRSLAPLHRERTWSPIRNLTYLAGESDFNGFIESLLARQPGFVTRMFETYIGPPGYPLVDYVGRQEHLRSDLEKILKLLGWDGAVADITAENIGISERPTWDKELRARFLLAEVPAILRWYSSPGPFRVTTE